MNASTEADGNLAQAYGAAERRAEKALAILRVGAAAALMLTTYQAGQGVDPHSLLLSLTAYGVLAIVGMFLAWIGFYRPWLPWTMSTAELVLFAHCLSDYAWLLRMPPEAALGAPGGALIYLYLAQAAVRYRASLVIYTGSLFIGIWLFMLGAWNLNLKIPGGMSLATFMPGAEAAIRLTMIALVTGTLALAIRWRRRNLLSSIVDSRVKHMLRRFVPEPLFHLLEKDSADELGLRKIDAAVLFVDLRGFTGFAQRAALGDVVAMLSEFRTRCTRIVRAHGGAVDKFVGDSVMAVFQDVRSVGRALTCAEALAVELGLWSDSRRTSDGSAIDFGITLHSGAVACGVVAAGGRSEYTVLGDAVNVAARMQDVAAQCGERLVVSEDVLLAAGDSVSRDQWMRLPDFILRGHSGSIPFFRLRAATSDVTPSHRASAQP